MPETISAKNILLFQTRHRLPAGQPKLTNGVVKHDARAQTNDKIN